MDATGSLATPSNRKRPLGSPLEGPEDPSTEQRPPKKRRQECVAAPSVSAT